MKINCIPKSVSLNENSKQQNLVKSTPALTSEASILNLKANYNVAFSGLFYTEPECFQNLCDVERERILQKDKFYKVSKYSIFRLDNQLVDFKSPEFAQKINELNGSKTLVLGRQNMSEITGHYNPYISASHLEIRKAKDGNFIVRDLNSTNGTTYMGTSLTPPKVDDNYKYITTTTPLKKRSRTLVPKDAQLYLGGAFAIDLRNPNLINILDEKGKITLGREYDSDILVPDYYDTVSRKHLVIERIGSDIVVTDVGALNESLVVPKNEIKPFYCGVENINLKQNNVGDCYLLSTIYAMSRNPVGQKMLNKMVTIDKEGNYIVKFHNREPITVDKDELDGQSAFLREKKINVHGELGIRAIERAYGKTVKRFHGEATMHAALDEGSNPIKALRKMTGLDTTWYDCRKDNISKILGDIAYGGMHKHIVTCSTPAMGNYGSGKYVDKECRFNRNHAYAIENIDPINKTLEIVNPHNTKNHQVISWDEFTNLFDYIYDAYVAN